MNWREDCISRIQRASVTPEILFGEIAAIAREMGFQDVAYGLRTKVPVARPTVIMLNTYPEAWKVRYVEQNYLRVDPTVQHALTDSKPMLWSHSLLAEAPEFWDDARNFGLSNGWAMACRDQHGSVGLLSVARPAEALTEAELDLKEPRLMWLATMAHAAIGELLTPLVLPETQQHFTPRERDVLRWTVEGKTGAEIAQILQISHRTFVWHMNNVMAKLDVTTKAEAAMKAALLNIL